MMGKITAILQIGVTLNGNADGLAMDELHKFI